MNYREAALKIHEELKGKLGIYLKSPLETKEHLSTLYTPGVAEPCLKIHQNKDDLYKYTAKGNFVAVVSDGSAVLGLGNIGGAAGLPVMEGKAVLFKRFGGVDAIPLCLNTQDSEEIISIVKAVAPTFGGINLEDISAPRCFEIERRLKRELDIPVFHDDQHGTAIVTLAGMINAMKITGKRRKNIKVVINGAGSAGIAIARILLSWKVENILICDRRGIISSDDESLNAEKISIARQLNPEKEKGTIHDAVKGADFFIGVSAPGILTAENVKSMADDPVIFAMANPIPEIYPDEAYAGGAKVVATGRSDFKNQVNNVLAFPGIFRGALDVRSREISEGMKVAAANAIAGLISEGDLKKNIIIPDPFNPDVAKEVAFAVGKEALIENLTAETISDKELSDRIEKRFR